MPEPKWNGLKTIFLILLAGVFLSLAMCGVTLRRTIAQFGHHASAQEESVAARPSPFRGTGAQQNAAGAQAAAFRSFSYLAGIWQGSGILPATGTCGLRFEMRPRLENRFAGYATLTCLPLSPPRTPDPVSMALQRSPRSSILIGIPGNGEVAFHAEKLIGTSEECPISELTALPFGTTQLAVEWKNNGCPSGQILLSKIGQ
jgi:hypothetical protein